MDRPGEAKRVLCPVSESCGGCPHIALDYRASLERKRQRFTSLWQVHGLSAPELTLVPSPRTVGYRNRVRLRIDECGSVTFFNEGKARDCAVLEPSVLEGKAQLEQAAARAPGALRGFRHAEVRARDSDGQGALVLHGPRAPQIPENAFAASEASGWLATAVQTGESRALPSQTWRVQDEVFLLVPVNAFMQINWAVNRALVAHVVSGLVQRGARDFADLFMGAGNFGLPLLARGLTGTGVESHRGALFAADEAARRQGLGFEELLAEDALEVARRFSAAGRAFDAVIVDPPRAGLKAGVDRYAALARNTLVACSCNPSSLAKDVRELCRLGFDVQSATLFDMFPHTDSIEAVVWLDRS